MHPIRTAAAVLCALLLATSAHAACSVADIEIKTWTWNRDAGWFTVAGEILNKCAEPTGARLQVTFREASGQVVSVEDAWASGNRNIRARETYTFKISTRGYASAKDVTIRVIEVRQWPAS